MVLKILGQSAPAAAVETDVYTVPVGKQTAISNFKFCNFGVADDTITIRVANNGAASSNEQLHYFELPITGNDTFSSVEGITVDEGDVIRFTSSNGTVAFNLSGDEV